MLFLSLTWERLGWGPLQLRHFESGISKKEKIMDLSHFSTEFTSKFVDRLETQIILDIIIINRPILL